MSDKKELNFEELEKISGGFDFSFFDTSFNENTKVKTIVDKYPWVVNLYPALEMAAKMGLTIGTACSIGNITYEQLQSVLSEYETKYDENGNPKV